jgi:hypothetical protein
LPSGSSEGGHEMIQGQGTEWSPLPAKSNPPQIGWMEFAPAKLFCNFNVSNFISRLDFDFLDEGASAHHARCEGAEGVVTFSKSQKSHVDNLHAELVEQGGHLQSRQQEPSPTNDSQVAKGKGAARRLNFEAAKLSLESCYQTSTERTIDSMIKTGKVEISQRAQLSSAADIPEASTSGRVGGEFWKERSDRKILGFDYLPLGTLYNVHEEAQHQKHWGLQQRKTVEDNVRINENHSVSTGYQQGMQVDERGIWLSTSHKLGRDHVLGTQYADDLKGGNNFIVNTTHSCIGDSTLSTNLSTSSSADYTFEVELQREKKKGHLETLESVMANFRTGERLLKLQEKIMLKDVEFLNSIVSDFRGMNVVKFMASLSGGNSGLLSGSVASDLQGNNKICLNATQKLHDQILIGASLNTDLKQEEFTSLEGKYQLNGRGNLVLRLTNYHNSVLKWEFTTSLTTEQNNWLCSYIDSRAEGCLLGCEWRREISPQQFLTLRASAKNWVWTLFSEMAIPC